MVQFERILYVVVVLLRLNFINYARGELIFQNPLCFLYDLQQHVILISSKIGVKSYFSVSVQGLFQLSKSFL